MNSRDNDEVVARFRSALGDIMQQETVVDGLSLIRLFVRIPTAAGRARVLALARELASPEGKLKPLD